MTKKVVIYLLLIVFGIGIVYASPQQKTYIIPIKGEINSALVSYIDKAIGEAEANKAAQIIFEIDTEGGLVQSALQISKKMIGTSIPTVAYIKDNAISAGVIIAISGDKIVANKKINIGSAETRPKEEKYISYWVGELRSIAELKNRNSEVIAAMADADIEIKDVKEKGKLLNLTANDALKHGIVDQVVSGRVGLYEYLGIRQDDIVELEYDFQTNVARFTNSMLVSSLLITLGIIGIVAEIFTPGFGILGSVGILSFALFFAGRVLAGHAGWGVLILFIAGVILLGIELTIPGFGAPGISGVCCVVLSILLGSADPVQGAASFSIGVVLSIIVLTIIFKYAPKNKLFDHIILKAEQKNEEGYAPHHHEKSELIGIEGEAITLLRPSGTILVDDKRLDVVTEGTYIESGSRVKIIDVEGNKIIVRKVE